MLRCRSWLTTGWSGALKLPFVSTVALSSWISWTSSAASSVAAVVGGPGHAVLIRPARVVGGLVRRGIAGLRSGLVRRLTVQGSDGHRIHAVPPVGAGVVLARRVGAELLVVERRR